MSKKSFRVMSYSMGSNIATGVQKSPLNFCVRVQEHTTEYIFSVWVNALIIYHTFLLLQIYSPKHIYSIAFLIKLWELEGLFDRFFFGLLQKDLERKPYRNIVLNQ